MNKKLQSHGMPTDVLVSKVNNRLQASLRNWGAIVILQYASLDKVLDD